MSGESQALDVSDSISLSFILPRGDCNTPPRNGGEHMMNAASSCAGHLSNRLEDEGCESIDALARGAAGLRRKSL